MTFGACYSCNLVILGVLKATFFLTSRNIWEAVAPPLPTGLKIMERAPNLKLKYSQKALKIENVAKKGS